MQDSKTLSIEETHRRMPALSRIENDHIQDETTWLTANAPDYFWEVPASTSGYHNPLCTGRHGLWIHTLMVSQAVEDLCWTYESRGLIAEGDMDYARAAAILHDQRKNGPPENPSEKSVSDHDIQMAQVIREGSLLPEEVAEAVEAHMGASYDGPTPEAGTLNDFVHMADYAASRKTWTVDVPGPIPEELTEMGLSEAE